MSTPNFLILIPHFEQWCIDTKNTNFKISQYDQEKVVATLGSGYAFVRTRFLDRSYNFCNQSSASSKIIEYTYEYAYRDINGLVNITNPSDQTSSIYEIEREIELMMVSDGYADF